MLKRFFLYSLAGLIVAGVAFKWSDKPDPVADERAAPRVDEAGTVRVGSIRLWQDYAANEVAADNLYKGKRLRVIGRVLTIDKDPYGAAVLNLVSGNAIFQTMATLEADQTQRAATLTKGTQVEVECVGKGVMMKMPQLENCSLLAPQ